MVKPMKLSVSKCGRIGFVTFNGTIYSCFNFKDPFLVTTFMSRVFETKIQVLLAWRALNKVSNNLRKSENNKGYIRFSSHGKMPIKVFLFTMFPWGLKFITKRSKLCISLISPWPWGGMKRLVFLHCCRKSHS